MTRTKTKRTITVLAQGLQALARAAGDKNHYPALETLFCRGSHFGTQSQSPDHLRFKLFGIEPEGELPIASLTRAADQGENPGQHQYWLRLDPVTLMVDMARVVMTSHGFAGLDEFERSEIEKVVRSVLHEQGIVLHCDHPERWCIALDEPLNFGFTPLEDALGMDLAEVFPEHPDALHWRGIINEIEIALHESSLKLRRRQKGQLAINSVWFWGGGFIPDVCERGVFDTVYSDHPVTRGLAVINDCRLRKQLEVKQVNFHRDGQSILVDWTVRSRDPKQELDSLERFVQQLLGKVRDGSIELVFYCGKCEGWRYGRCSGWRFWRFRQPLGKICFSSLPA
ncbi:MAG: hypothetical protein IID60_12630 [Proteobacteria bacterium]|nr:hypothetical protein [Pseudomonadota bacterium]